MAKQDGSFYDRIAPVLLLVVVALAFGVGILWQKVSDIQSGGAASGAAANNVAGAPTQPQEPPKAKLDSAQAAKIPLVSSFSEQLKPQEGQKLRENDHIRGSKNPEVLLIEYSDFECPFCARFHPTAVEALEEYGDKLAMVYRHFPLDSIHPKARPAANASECAAEIGGVDKFWAFTDELYANQTTALSDFSATAVKVGINKAAFDTCVSENRHEDRVQADYQEGLDAGVTGTPGNFIVNKNGEVWQLPGAVPYATLKSTIEEALAAN